MENLLYTIETTIKVSLCKDQWPLLLSVGSPCCLLPVMIIADMREVNFESELADVASVSAAVKD